MTKHGKKVLLLHNTIAPYRLPLFAELSRKWELEVYFCQAKTKGRLWPTSTDGYSLKPRVLKNMTLGNIIVNPWLPFNLLFNRFDAYIVGENGFQTLFPIAATFLAAKLFNKPFIVWSATIDSEYHQQQYNSLLQVAGFIDNIYRKLLYRFTDSFIAYGIKAKEYLVKRGVADNKIFTGTQVIIEQQNEMVSISKKDLGFAGKKVILFLGYLKVGKGVEILINAYKRMDRDDAVLVIAGAGKEEGKLKSLAGERGDICFPGYVTGREKAKYYSVADVFVLPSFHEAWALVINEAMFYGLPIITTEEAGSTGELVWDNGLIVKAGDEGALEAALKKLLDNEELRQEMGQKSQEYVKHYDINYAVKCFEDAVNYATKNEEY